METPTPQIDPITTTSKGKWATFIEAVGNPFTFLTTWTKKSPILSILALVFLVQPVVSMGISLVQEWASVKEQLDPTKRPVTKGELDLVNSKVDFIQNLIVADMKARADYRAQHQTKTPTSVVNAPGITDSASVDTKVATPLNNIQHALTEVQKPLDADFAKKQPKK